MRIALLLALTALPLGATPAPQSALEAFGALAVGTWEADDGRQVLEWGVGRKLIRSRSYFPAEDGWRLVSEGIWYEDAEDGVVRGTVLATDMPIERFEYESRVEGDRIINRLDAHGPAGGDYVETWNFAGDTFAWTLETVTEDGGLEPMMEGEYRRAPGS